MEKRLLNTEEDLYKVLDDVYDIIPDDDINKAIYESKEEQYEYQLSHFEKPTSYPCIMTYDVKEYHHCIYNSPLNNKDYYFIYRESYIYPTDFGKVFTTEQVRSLLEKQMEEMMFCLGLSSKPFHYPTDFEEMKEWMMKTHLVVDENGNISLSDVR